MYKEYFADHPFAPLGLVAMGIFMALFFIVVVRAWRRSPQEDSTLAALPLTDAPSLHGRNQ